jgi:hypothetical protein
MKNKHPLLTGQLPTEFKALDYPAYEEAALGRWKIFQAPTIAVPVAAYFTTVAAMPAANWVLMKNHTVWMSLTPMEMQSQGYHARLAAGHVVVMGLGMGALVFNLLQNPRVTKITVCELEPEVVELLKMAAPWFAQACQSGHLEIHVGDAFEFKIKGGIPDLLLVDIWAGMGNSRSESDVLRITQNVPARTVGWWGQELAIVDWIHEKFDAPNRFPFRREHVQSYERRLGVHLLGSNHSQYPAMIRKAATSATLAMNAKAHQPNSSALMEALAGLPLDLWSSLFEAL